MGSVSKRFTLIPVRVQLSANGNNKGKAVIKKTVLKERNAWPVL